MNVWLTSDTHFHHQNIIEYCDRPFPDLEAMHHDIVYDWNAVVNPEDHVYHLGDFSLGNKDEIREMERKLAGKKMLVLGNHDYESKEFYESIFELGVCRYHEFNAGAYFEEHNDVQLCLSHYPMLSWNKKYHGSVQVHGHTHDSGGVERSSPDGERSINYNEPRRFDVGVDGNTWLPVSLLQLIENHVKVDCPRSFYS